MHNRIISYLYENHDIDIDRRRGYCYTSYHDSPAIEFTLEEETSDMPKKFSLEDASFELKNISKRRSVEKYDYVYAITYDNTNFATTEFTGYTMQGAIDPDGNFYDCPPEGHYNLDAELIERSLIKKSPEWNSKAIEYWGWLILTSAYFSDCEFDFKFQISDWDFKTQEYNILRENKLTDKQIEFIKKYKKSLINEGDPNTFVFNFKWFKTDNIDEDCKTNFENGEYNKEEL